MGSAATSQRDLFLAILAMDSYHRGYNRGLVGDASVIASMIGDATVGVGSAVSEDDNSSIATAAKAIGFFAQSYDWNGETIIAYRGTDNGVFTYGLDQQYGYLMSIGGGDTAQGRMAIE